VRQEILDMCVAVLRRSGYPAATPDSALRDPTEAAAGRS
jgi:hypothetical protein